jgi:hypothetical protein
LLQDGGIDHGGGQIVVPEQLLNGTGVGAEWKQVGREGVAKGMGADGLRQTGTVERYLDGFVDTDAAHDSLGTGSLGMNRLAGKAENLSDLIAKCWLWTSCRASHTVPP